MGSWVSGSTVHQYLCYKGPKVLRVSKNTKETHCIIKVSSSHQGIKSVQKYHQTEELQLTQWAGCDRKVELPALHSALSWKRPSHGVEKLWVFWAAWKKNTRKTVFNLDTIKKINLISISSYLLQFILIFCDRFEPWTGNADSRWTGPLNLLQAGVPAEDRGNRAGSWK